MYKRFILGTFDYVVISLSLGISAAIGIVLKCIGGRYDSATSYLMAGKNMSKLPVILSIVVTLTSPVALLSLPMEVYLYGTQLVVQTICMPIGMLIAAYVIIPVYFQCEVSSINEFLEMRYGKYTRRIISVVTYFQLLLYMSITVYGSVLALSAVSDISVEMSIWSMGLLCTFYCCLGGLKAVLWTDVFQFVLIFIYMIIMFITGLTDAGGFAMFFNRLQEGGRIEFFDFRMDFFERYTFWNNLIKGVLFGCSYGVMQIEVQRVLSLSDSKKASETLAKSSILVSLTYFLAGAFGAVIYAVFYGCDPLLDKEETGLLKYDQVIPYYIITKFRSIPGLTGLCISGIFCASLSSVSSALNSLSTVTIMDFIRPLTEKKKQMEDGTIVFLAKGLSLFYGMIGIVITFALLPLKSLMVIYNSVFANEGIIVSIFLIGVLTRKSSDKVTVVCFILSSVSISWIAFGSLLSHHQSPYLPLSSNNCTSNPHSPKSLFENTLNCTEECSTFETSVDTYEEDIFVLYKISYVWYSAFGFILNLTLMGIGILLTGWNNDVIPADSKCLSPITRFWMKNRKLGLKDMEIGNNLDVSTSSIF